MRSGEPKLLCSKLCPVEMLPSHDEDDDVGGSGGAVVEGWLMARC